MSWAGGRSRSSRRGNDAISVGGGTVSPGPEEPLQGWPGLHFETGEVGGNGGGTPAALTHGGPCGGPHSGLIGERGIDFGLEILGL